PDVFHHRLVDAHHRTQTKVVGSAHKHLVELPDLGRSVLQTRSPIRMLTQAPTRLLNLLRRRAGADVLPSRTPRVAPAERVTQQRRRDTTSRCTAPLVLVASRSSYRPRSSVSSTGASSHSLMSRSTCRSLTRRATHCISS